MRMRRRRQHIQVIRSETPFEFSGARALGSLQPSLSPLAEAEGGVITIELMHGGDAWLDDADADASGDASLLSLARKYKRLMSEHGIADERSNAGTNRRRATNPGRLSDQVYCSTDDIKRMHANLLIQLGGRPVATVRPHPEASVLLGDAGMHSYSEIILTEWATGTAAAAACATLAPLRTAFATLSGGAVVTLAAKRSEAFSGMATFEQSGGAVPPVNTAPARPPADCPFTGEPNALPDNWDVLESEPSE